MEAKYHEKQRERLLPAVRYIYAIAPVLYLGYVLWDLHIEPSRVGETLVIRALGAAGFLGLFLLTFSRHAPARMTAIVNAGVLLTALGVSVILLRLPHGFDYGAPALLFCVLANLALAPSLSAAGLGYAIAIAIPNAVMWLGGVPGFTLINTDAFLVPQVALSVLLSYLLDQKNRDAFRYETEYERLASTDLLTGISNRRGCIPVLSV